MPAVACVFRSSQLASPPTFSKGPSAAPLCHPGLRACALQHSCLQKLQLSVPALTWEHQSVELGTPPHSLTCHEYQASVLWPLVSWEQVSPGDRRKLSMWAFQFPILSISFLWSCAMAKAKILVTAQIRHTGALWNCRAPNVSGAEQADQEG